MASFTLKDSAHYFLYKFHMLVPKSLIWSKLHASNYHPDVEGIKLRIETAKADSSKYSLLQFWGENLGIEINVLSKSVLEIGHGGGWYLAEMMDAGALKVEGLEISQELNNRASQALISSGYSNFRLGFGNGKNLEVLRNSKYDLIYANTVIQHLSTFTLKRYMKDISAIMADGGKCMLQVLQTSSKFSQKRLSGSDLFSVAYTASEFQSLVTKTGMAIDSYVEITYGNDGHYWGLYVLSKQ